MSRTACLARCVLVVAALGVVPATVAGAPQQPAGGGSGGAAASRAPQGLNLSGALLGGVPSGDVRAEPIALTLADALARGLRQNLGVLAQEATVVAARGNRWRTLSDLLPRLSARVGETRQQTSLAAFGITLPGLPTIVGPFNVFDARLYVSQTLWDTDALYSARAGAAALRAEEYSLQNARELVVLVVRSLYLQAVAAESRLKAARAQTETALVLYNLATDLRTNGVVAGIDVLRAQVQVQLRRQRVIVTQNDFEKQKLQLARAIGLPVGQTFTLADAMPYEPLKAVSLDEALARAYESREDYRAAQALVEAAQAARKAALGDNLPSVQVGADYGSIGNKVGDVAGTYSVVTQVRIPIFDAAAVRGRVLEADGVLRLRQSELADFKARVDEEVRTALLDLSAAEEQLQVAQTTVTLATQELAQSQDRFAAGVAGNVEVVQAQEAVAVATESYIAGLYAHNIAKASLARAVGLTEGAESGFLGGRR
jgi:outer membrane protein TolC